MISRYYSDVLTVLNIGLGFFAGFFFGFVVFIVSVNVPIGG